MIMIFSRVQKRTLGTKFAYQRRVTRIVNFRESCLYSKTESLANNAILDVSVFSRPNLNVFIISVDENLSPGIFWFHSRNFHPQNYDTCIAQCAMGFVREK